MKFIKVKNYKELSKKSSEIIIKEILKKPNLSLTLATGKTPKGLYKNLVKAYKNKKVDFSKLIFFNLDEFYPIKKTNKKSYYYYLHKNLFNKINIKKANIHLLNGETKNPQKECKDYEQKVKKNKIDICILGLGVNGHIAFNEPGSLVNSKTRLVNLKHKTITNQALSQGIQTILSSRKIILLASGRKKSKSIKKLLDRKITKEYPVTYLKKHKNLIVIADKKTLS